MATSFYILGLLLERRCPVGVTATRRHDVELEVNVKIQEGM